MGSRDPSNDDLNVTQDLEIDRICVRFENALVNGTQPSIEQFLANVDELLRPRLLKQLLLLELEHAKGLGNESDVNGYLTRFPNDQALIYSVFVEHVRSIEPAETEAQDGKPDESGSSHVDSSASDSSHHERFPSGTRLADRYRIVSLLGKGGMGEVYRADDLKLGHSVALKFLPRELASDSRRLEYLYNEVRLSRQISHPNICRVYDIAEVNGQHFLSMEYVDGEDLKGLLRRVGRFPQERGIEIARQLCAGLAAAHDRGVLHRDLKPANVMIDGRGRVRITDFGLATVIEERESGASFVGTPAYMAPEQLKRAETSFRSDIYSLGLVLYEVFTGKPAYESRSSTKRETERDDSSTPSRPSDSVGDMNPSVERVIMRCLERDPKCRPNSVAAVAVALPGGDPLAAALAAGETPSPEMVAAAGGTGTLSPVVAALYMGIVLTGLITLSYLQGYVPPGFHTKPDRLAVKAEEILRDAGLETVMDSHHLAYGFRYNEDLQRISRLGRERVGEQPEEFWYRRSPQFLTPFELIVPTTDVPRTITLHNPPPLLETMLSIRLSADGRLRELLYVTEQQARVGETGNRMDGPSDEVWAMLFRHCEFDYDDFVPEDAPEWTAPFAATHQFAWRFKDSQNETHGKFRVEAASHRGRVVYFQVIAPWTSRQWTVDRISGETTWGPGATSDRSLTLARASFDIVVYLLLAAAILMARNNIRRGKCDIGGACKVGIAMFLVNLLMCLSQASHLPSKDAEMMLFDSALMRSLTVAFYLWMFYAAIESHVRRYWPNSLVSWGRVMAGRLGDPLVGRDVLIGATTGILALHVVAILNSLHLTTPLSYRGEIFASTRYAFAQIPASLNWGVTLGLAFLTMLLLFRIMLRKPWGAAGGLFLLLMAPALYNSPDWLSVTVPCTVCACVIFLLTRFGLMACISFEVVLYLEASLPLPHNLTIWYASTGLICLVAITAWAGYGCYVSVAGKSDVLLLRDGRSLGDLS